MKIWPALICASLATSALAQPEDEFERGFALAAKKGCLDCHALGHAYVGPSFISIAEHYRHDPEAPGQIADVIQAGSRGHWGERFNMWPQVHLTPEELQRLVRWVLMQ
jgi:cytochrome c